MEELRLLNPRWLASYAARRVAQFVERCHERGVSVTPQRLEVIRALLTSENHPRAVDIHVAVRKIWLRCIASWSSSVRSARPAR